MRKGVAVPYVIALILGVAVIALIGIWFVMSGGKFSKQSFETLCQSKIVVYCNKLISDPLSVSGGDWDSNCNIFFGITTTPAPPLTKCKQILGIT